MIPVFAFAHQPRLNTSPLTEVTDPEISKAYYGVVSVEPHIYHIVSDVPFNLYVNILVPDMAGQKTDMSFLVLKKGEKVPIVAMDSDKTQWKKFFEPFGHDSYMQGGEYKAKAEAGEYRVVVWSKDPVSHYSLAIGEIENFDLKEIVNAINLIPTIKKNIFNKNPIDFVLSPYGAGYLVTMLLLAFIVGFVYRFIVKKISDKKVKEKVLAGEAVSAPRNIGLSDRLLRTGIGLALLLWAMTTTWSPILLFAAGFCFFEAIFSWCAFFQAIGRNTCEG